MKRALRAALFPVFVLSALLAGCNTGATVPTAIEGSWYAGAGYTTAPYNPDTGEFGKPSGQGLVFVFRDDGSYTKAYQSYNSAGGCTNGFTAFDEGDLSFAGSSVVLAPSSSHTQVSDTCAPSLDSDEPNEDVAEEQYDYTVNGDELTLIRRSDGASSVFRRLQ